MSVNGAAFPTGARRVRNPHRSFSAYYLHYQRSYTVHCTLRSASACIRRSVIYASPEASCVHILHSASASGDWAWLLSEPRTPAPATRQQHLDSGPWTMDRGHS
eukprot:scaffold5918_cov124-Isochrysis_galbana.AAC.20